MHKCFSTECLCMTHIIGNAGAIIRNTKALLSSTTLDYCGSIFRNLFKGDFDKKIMLDPNSKILTINNITINYALYNILGIISRQNYIACPQSFHGWRFFGCFVSSICLASGWVSSKSSYKAPTNV